MKACRGEPRLWPRLAPLLVALATLGLLAVAAPAHAATVGQAQPDVTDDEVSGPQPQNVVQIDNTQDGVLTVRGAIQLAHIDGTTVEPLNEAEAVASCTGCSTFAVALQIVLYRSGATDVAPQNYAVAFNDQCDQCVTVADAYQFVIPVPDPDAVPPRVHGLINSLDMELRNIAGDQHESPGQAEQRIDAVISRFTDLGIYLTKQHAEDRHSDNPGGSGGSSSPDTQPQGPTAAAPVAWREPVA